MSSLLDVASSFGGRESSGAIIVPAEQLAAFLTAASEKGVDVPYIECLYLGLGFTEPSMELSASPTDFSDWSGFFAFAMDAAEKAITRARTGEHRRVASKAEAVFEVGIPEAP